MHVGVQWGGCHACKGWHGGGVEVVLVVVVMGGYVMVEAM